MSQCIFPTEFYLLFSFVTFAFKIFSVGILFVYCVFFSLRDVRRIDTIIGTNEYTRTYQNEGKSKCKHEKIVKLNLVVDFFFIDHGCLTFIHSSIAFAFRWTNEFCAVASLRFKRRDRVSWFQPCAVIYEYTNRLRVVVCCLRSAVVDIERKVIRLVNSEHTKIFVNKLYRCE